MTTAPAAGACGGSSKAMVSNLDLAETFLDVAGAEISISSDFGLGLERAKAVPT